MDALRSTLWIGSTYSRIEKVVQCVLKDNILLSRPMSIYKVQNCILTPGEYIENPWYFSALLVSSYDVDTVVLVYRLGEPFNPYPPAIASAFNRNVVGVLVIKEIIEKELFSNIEDSINLLRLAGAATVCAVSEKEHVLEKLEFNETWNRLHVISGFDSLRTLLAVNDSV